jgi:hypothetical protein
MAMESISIFDPERSSPFALRPCGSLMLDYFPSSDLFFMKHWTVTKDDSLWIAQQ